MKTKYIVIISILVILFSGCVQPEPEPEIRPVYSTPNPIIVTPTPIPELKYNNYLYQDAIKYVYLDSKKEDYDLIEKVIDCGDGCINWNDITEENLRVWYEKGNPTAIISKIVIINQRDGYLNFEILASGTYNGRDYMMSEHITMKAGNYEPIPVSTPTPTLKPTPESTQNSNTREVWDFVKYAQENWVYELDQPGEVVQEPGESYKRLSGDCDDFAVMIAYYIQEVYGYDTKIIVIDQSSWNTGLHAVTFVHVTDELAKEIADGCGTSIPTLTSEGNTYIAFDWKICPGWQWTNTNSKIQSQEWSYYSGKIV